MVRKNPFANLIDNEESVVDTRALDYATKGATRSLLNSIDEMASQADQLLAGETIVELDPDLIDDSFAKDRVALGDDDYAEEFQRVLDAVRERGQDTPVLVRPHPSAAGRYMLVFGHLRRRAAYVLRAGERGVLIQLQG